MRIAPSPAGLELRSDWAGVQRLGKSRPPALLVLACGLGLPAMGFGQDSILELPPSADDAPPPPRTRAKVKRRQVVPAQAVAEEAPTEKLLSPENVKSPPHDDELIDIQGPAPDPVWPNWAAANDPARQPIFAPGGYYDLVRPPDGISPDEEGQEYQRAVASEGDLFFHEATCQPAIDLLRPDGMAPAGVFGDHTLNTGGRILMSYRFNNQAFDGMRDGTHSVSTASVLGEGAFRSLPRA